MTICSAVGTANIGQRVLYIGTFTHRNVSKIDYEIKSTQHYCPLVETVSFNIFQHCQFQGVHLDINSSYQMVNLYAKFIFSLTHYKFIRCAHPNMSSVIRFLGGREGKPFGIFNMDNTKALKIASWPNLSRTDQRILDWTALL